MKKIAKPLLFWLILVAATLSFGLLAGESLCRLAGVGKPNLTLTGPKRLFVPDPDPLIAFRMRPGYEDFVYGSTVSINPKGLRDRDYPYQKPNDTKRILVLGDSVAFGYGVPVQDTFSKQWERFLHQNGHDAFQIINSGVPSYTTVQEVRWFEVEGLNYQPDAAVLTYVMNDPEPVHQLDANGGWVPLAVDHFYAEIAALFPQPILPLTQHLHLMNFLNRLMLHTHPNWREIHNRLTQYFNQDIFQQEGWEACQKAVARFKSVCDQQDIDPLAVIYPLMYRLHAKEEHDFLPHYQRVYEMFTANGIPCILPLDDYIGKHVDTMRAYADDPHPSRASHRIMAKRLHQSFAGKTPGVEARRYYPTGVSREP